MEEKERVVVYKLKSEISLLENLKGIMKKHGYRQLAPFIRMILYRFLDEQDSK